VQAVRILLVGASGMLGSRMGRTLGDKGHEVVAPSLEELDLSGEDGARGYLETARFEALVNCAAFTDVDACENDETFRRALLLNGTAVGWLAEACRSRKAILVHFSTDYVFDGLKDSPYVEEDPTDPLNAYGRTKREGERVVEAAGCRAAILRTSWLYGPGGRHFVATVARLMGERDILEVVDDQRGAPTNTADLAAFTEELLASGEANGIYHFSNEGETTWYGVALEVKRILGLSCRIEPTTSDRFPRPARRPANSRFDLSRSRRAVGHAFRTWQEALEDYLKREYP